MKRQTLTLIIIVAFLAGFLFHHNISPNTESNKIDISPSRSDTLEVMKIIFEDFPKAYQKGKFSSLYIADLFFKDADMVILSSNWIKNQNEIKKRFDYLEDFPEGRTIYFELESIYFVEDKVAWVNVNSCDKGGYNEQGEELGIYCDRGSFLLEKRFGKWKIKALRAFEPPLKKK
jgi:hypothetical protein